MSDLREVAAVFSVGKTAEGCEFALRWIVNERKERPHLFFLYGEAAPGQAESPLSAVHNLLTHPEFQDLPRGGEKATHAFSLDHAYATALDFIRGVEARGFQRVYLGITGGTNPMVAALFRAMDELSCEVIPIYVQAEPVESGHQRSIEVISAAKAREAVRVERVSGLCRDGHLAAARILAGSLPESGRAGFIRACVIAFADWDNFEYEKPATELKGLSRRCEYLADEGSLQALIDTVQRYAKGIVLYAPEMEKIFRDHAQFERRAAKEGWEQQVRDQAIWLPLDALANGWRRLKEGRWTDAVMRAYRAVEVAIHCRLFALRIHPSKLDWGRAPLPRIAPAWCERNRKSPELPDQVAFEQALQLLELVTGEDFSDTRESRLKLQSSRNMTYLEHGYERRDAQAAERALELAQQLMDRILWTPVVEEFLPRLKMRF